MLLTDVGSPEQDCYEKLDECAEMLRPFVVTMSALLDRLSREELAGRGLELSMRPLLSDSRFLIKDSRTGRVYERIDCVSSQQQRRD